MFIICASLFFSAPVGAQAPAGEDAPGIQDTTHDRKVHALQGNRPLYRRSGEVLVQFQQGSNRDVLNTPTLSTMIKGTRASHGGIEAVIFDEATVDFAALRDQLLATPGVLRVEPNILISTQDGVSASVDVDHSSKQWHLGSTPGHSRLMLRSRAPLPAGQAVRIGVIDTGVDYTHREFTGRTLPGVNLISDPLPGEDPASAGDLNGHGTRVAGIIAAADDDRGVLGINPRATICSIKTFNRDGTGYLEDIIAGIDWAIGNRMHVINMSFGTYGYSELLHDAITRARDAGILLVAAAGNDAAETAMFPAAFEGVLSVGAYDDGGWTSHFSNWGPLVDFHAPGDRLLTTDLWREGYHPYAVFHGTSAAAAYTTGVASLLIEDGESADATADILRKNVIASAGDRYLRSQHDLWLNGRLIMARLLGEQFSELKVVSFRTDRSIFAHEENVSVGYEVQNTGTLPTEATEAWLTVSEGETVRRVDLARVPALLPGERHEESSVVAVSRFLGQTGSAETGGHRLRAELELGSFPDATHARRRLLITAQPAHGIDVGALWVSPLDLNEANAERTLYATVQNAGRERQDGLVARVYAVAAVHEGIFDVPKTELGTIPVGSLMPGESRRLSLSLSGYLPPARRVTFWIEIEGKGGPLTRHLQGYTYAESGGTATPEYAQSVHRTIVDEAIKLLEAQGIVIPDLQNPQYRGVPTHANSWPFIGTLPLGEWWYTGYWSDDWLANDPNGAGYFGLGLADLTLIDGSHDCDAIDIAFGYTEEDTFDSHFWIVDNSDDDGLNSLSTNHHSALTKIRALLYGNRTTNCTDGCPGPAAPSDIRLHHGAIDHYLEGHKQAAWWFMGHAVHLIGDLSVPSHVVNENAHGVWGATYHDWMDSGGAAFWDFNDADARGGLIDPYDSDNAGDPVRYLAYTTAQVGDSFPWAETIGTDDGGDGDRTAGGDTPHYDATMQYLYGILNPRPLAKWHVNKDEVDDFISGCQLVDWVGPLETRDDCWGGEDGHTDYDNTDGDGNGDGNDDDGDLYRIGDENYPYAIRAVAGMIYHFAVQTGQIPFTVQNASDNGTLSLRDVIADAPPGANIEFDSSLSGQIVDLTTGQLLIDKSLTIDASALPAGLTINGNNSSRIFEIAGGATLTLDGLTLTGGSAFAANPGDRGGAILNRGTLTVKNSTLTGNSASVGGAIFNTTADAGGTFTMVNSTVSGNNATWNGGALLNEFGDVTVIHSTLAGNTAGAFGGGIDNAGGTAIVNDSIVAGNSAPSGPDIGNRDGGSVTGHYLNLVGDNETVTAEFPANGTLVGGNGFPPVDPMLAALGNNGGPTMTRLPLPGSPAINGTPSWQTVVSVTTDQRGLPRPGPGFDDLGSVELPECGNSILVAGEVCDDGNALGGDCCSAVCLYEAPGSACDVDLNVCTLDTCNGGGSCFAGAPLVCDDADVCTDNQCNPATGCFFSNNTASCDDGDACTMADVCSSGACLGVPADVPGPFASLAASDATGWTWQPHPQAESYDVVMGDLGLLRSGGGDFFTATTGCLADGQPVTTLDHTDVPAADSGFFFLVRGENCTGLGTNDTLGPGQVASRDAGVDSAQIACECPCWPGGPQEIAGLHAATHPITSCNIGSAAPTPTRSYTALFSYNGAVNDEYATQVFTGYFGRPEGQDYCQSYGSCFDNGEPCDTSIWDPAPDVDLAITPQENDACLQALQAAELLLACP